MNRHQQYVSLFLVSKQVSQRSRVGVGKLEDLGNLRNTLFIPCIPHPHSHSHPLTLAQSHFISRSPWFLKGLLSLSNFRNF